MSDNKKKVNDVDLDFFDVNVDLENPFSEEIDKSKARPVSGRKLEAPAPLPDEPSPEEPKKRTSRDFSPDMDAILITAQSSMIIEGMKYFTKGDFTPPTLPIYKEALRGVSLYVKILDRNPANYAKLKALIDSDIECKEVEEIAFNLYRKIHGMLPESDPEKLAAFERFESLFRDAAYKASISTTMKLLKKYMLMSGSIDEVRIKESYNKNAADLTSDISNFEKHIKIAHAMLQKGKGELAKGLKGKDINIFIIKASYLLYYYYTLAGNESSADYYGRIHNNYKKYFIIRE